MEQKYKKVMVIAALGFGIAIAANVSAGSNDLSQKEPVSEENNFQAAKTINPAAVESYWTLERMANAKPMPTPLAVIDQSSLSNRALIEGVDQEIPEPAGYISGCAPKNSNCNPKSRTLASRQSQEEQILTLNSAPGDMIQPMHGAEPTNPLSGPYGPFQRWREAAPITAYPKSAIGKLFFTLNGTNFVCSASVIGRSTLITAGHCNSDGAGNFATNRLFCPSYNGSASSSRGCWTVVTSVVSFPWHTSGDPDYDYSCLVTNTAGTVVGDKIGNITGWLGRAWNFASSQAERTFGYPQAAPFDGKRLQTTASTEWYTHDFRSGGQVSKIIGSDLTGGSSGGPWILGWTGGLAETIDTDGSIATDPGSNWVNGVNSHKRCLVNCNTPPTTTSGVFWQEMSSPPFRKTTADNNDSEDVIALCLAHVNNNP